MSVIVFINGFWLNLEKRYFIWREFSRGGGVGRLGMEMFVIILIFVYFVGYCFVLVFFDLYG